MALLAPLAAHAARADWAGPAPLVDPSAPVMSHPRERRMFVHVT